MSAVAASIIVGSVGASLGAASLAWQISMFVMTRGRAKVVLKVGATGRGGMILNDAERAKPSDLEKHADQGFTNPVVAVDVINTGRLPITVARWSIKCDLGVSFIPIGDSIGPPLPHRLDVGEAETWATDLGNVIAMMKTTSDTLANGKPIAVFGYAELSDGRSARSRGTISS